MKTAIGGDRLGSGNKENVSMRNYERSTHDLSYVWRSSMASGTLVPFMSTVALPGDSMDIDLTTHVLTLPTVGPLFGSYKVQLDVFKVPVRLYIGKLHMNMLNIGLKMSDIKLPLMGVPAKARVSYLDQTFEDNEQIGSSCILKYLGMSGVGGNVATSATDVKFRYVNALSLLSYWDIFKNYYANKQEEKAYVIHTGASTISEGLTPIAAGFYERIDGVQIYTSIYNRVPNVAAAEAISLVFEFPYNAIEPDFTTIQVEVLSVVLNVRDIFDTMRWSPIGEGENRTERAKNLLICDNYNGPSTSVTWEYFPTAAEPVDTDEVPISLKEFDLENIDKMRQAILRDIENASAFKVGAEALEPYSLLQEVWGGVDNLQLSIKKSQEGLAVKTYQSDLFNNWIETEWIDGAGGINEITSVDTTGDSFTIDSLNLANKVYIMLNRIAISGGSYDDWIEAVYTEERRKKSVESPVYMGGLIRELTFEEVISNAESGGQPLGTLAGKGTLTGKNKGGNINIKVDEPSYIIGIASLTPRIDYSQGNKWDINLKTMDDFHKPALDAIGYQELITGQMFWGEDKWDSVNEVVTHNSAGKQPAWINYMTEVNRCYGNFAEPTKEMFMTNNRRYEPLLNPTGIEVKGTIKDLTTYIDPSKFNSVFADTRLDAQNFWVQIGVKNIARRKMSAKVIPNL